MNKLVRLGSTVTLTAALTGCGQSDHMNLHSEEEIQSRIAKLLDGGYTSVCNGAIFIKKERTPTGLDTIFVAQKSNDFRSRVFSIDGIMAGNRLETTPDENCENFKKGSIEK